LVLAQREVEASSDNTIVLSGASASTEVMVSVADEALVFLNGIKAVLGLTESEIVAAALSFYAIHVEQEHGCG